METQKPEATVETTIAAPLELSSTCPEPTDLPLGPMVREVVHFLEADAPNRSKSEVDTILKHTEQRMTPPNELSPSMHLDEKVSTSETLKLIDHNETNTNAAEVAKPMAEGSEIVLSTLDDEEYKSSLVAAESERDELSQKAATEYRDPKSTSIIANTEIVAEVSTELPSPLCWNEKHEKTLETADVTAEGPKRTLELTHIDEEHTVTRETERTGGNQESSSVTHHNLDTETADSVKSKDDVLKPDPQSAQTLDKYSKGIVDRSACIEEAVEDSHHVDGQHRNFLHKSLTKSSSVEDFQGHVKQEDTNLDADVKSCQKSPQPVIASISLISIPDSTLSNLSINKPISSSLSPSGNRSLHWKELIERGMGLHRATRKGIKSQAEQGGNTSPREESPSESTKVTAQPDHEDAWQTNQVDKCNQGQMSPKGHNGSSETPHWASSNSKYQTRRNGSNRENCKNMTRVGTMPHVETLKEKPVPINQQSQQFRRHSPKGKACRDDQQKSRIIKQIKDENNVPVSISEISCELTEEKIELKTPLEQEVFKNSTDHNSTQEVMTNKRYKQGRKPKRIIPGSGGNPSTEKMVESPVVKNTASEKAIGKSGRMPDVTLQHQPLNRVQSSSSLINHSHMNTNQENLKNPVNLLNQANQSPLDHSNQFTKMSVDGVGRTGRGARGRNNGRPGTAHHFSGGKQQLGFRVEQVTSNRRQRGFQPQGPTLSNTGASDHSNQGFLTDKQPKKENENTENTVPLNTNFLANNDTLMEQPINESMTTVDQEATSGATVGQLSQESTIIMNPPQLENHNLNSQFKASVNSPRSNSTGGNSQLLSPRDIHDSSWTNRSNGRQSGVRASLSQRLVFVDEQSSIVPNGNWDSSDVYTLPKSGNSSTYRIQLKNLPKYKFEGPPSCPPKANDTPAGTTTNTKAKEGSPSRQSVPEKKPVLAPSTSLQRSDRLQSPDSTTKNIDEISYVPPHLRVPTPKFAIPKTLVAVPKIYNIKPQPIDTKKGTKATSHNDPSKDHVADDDSNLTQAVDKKGKEKAEHTNGNVHANKPFDGSADPSVTVILPTKESSVAPHPLAGPDGKLTLPPYEWIGRQPFNSRTHHHVQAMDDWMTQQVSEVVNNPITLNTNDPSFETGEALAAGEIEFGRPIDSKEHETILPDDDFTHAKHHETAADAAKKLRFKVRQEHLETKAERKAYRLAMKMAEANYVPPPNPHVPLANIYLRPAEARDLRRITEIYNHYVTSSVVVAERDPMDERQWRARWNDAKDQRHAFIVAVQLSHKGGGYNRRNSDEVLAGFAYADDYGNNVNAYRYTAELQFYVANWISRSGVGKSLVDRMLAALDPCYYFRNGAPFEGGENYIWYEQGGVRLIKKIIISIPYAVKDDSALKWQKEWLAQFKFEQVATMPGVGYKFGKEINVAILMKETGTMLPNGT